MKIMGVRFASSVKLLQKEATFVRPSDATIDLITSENGVPFVQLKAPKAKEATLVPLTNVTSIVIESSDAKSKN